MKHLLTHAKLHVDASAAAAAAAATATVTATVAHKAAFTCIRRICGFDSSCRTLVGAALMESLLTNLRTEDICDFVQTLCTGHAENEVLMAASIVKCISSDDSSMRLQATRLVVGCTTAHSVLLMIANGAIGALVKTMTTPCTEQKLAVDWACCALCSIIVSSSRGVAKIFFAAGADAALMRALSVSLSKRCMRAAEDVVSGLLLLMAVRSPAMRKVCVALPEADGLVQTLRCFAHASNSSDMFRENASSLLGYFDSSERSKAGLFEQMQPLATSPDDYICAVCTEGGPATPICTPCMHYFHAPCLQMWLVKKDSCPLCNAAVLATLQTLLTSEV